VGKVACAGSVEVVVVGVVDVVETGSTADE